MERKKHMTLLHNFKNNLGMPISLSLLTGERAEQECKFSQTYSKAHTFIHEPILSLLLPTHPSPLGSSSQLLHLFKPVTSGKILSLATCLLITIPALSLPFTDKSIEEIISTH